MVISGASTLSLAQKKRERSLQLMWATLSIRILFFSFEKKVIKILLNQKSNLLFFQESVS